jgi:hypothetical protein
MFTLKNGTYHAQGETDHIKGRPQMVGTGFQTSFGNV